MKTFWKVLGSIFAAGGLCALLYLKSYYLQILLAYFIGCLLTVYCLVIDETYKEHHNV